MIEALETLPEGQASRRRFIQGQRCQDGVYVFWRPIQDQDVGAVPGDRSTADRRGGQSTVQVNNHDRDKAGLVRGTCGDRNATQPNRRALNSSSWTPPAP